MPQPRLPRLPILVSRKDPRSLIIIQRLQPHKRQHLAIHPLPSRPPLFPLDEATQQPQRAEHLSPRRGVDARDLHVVHDACLCLEPAAVEKAGHGGVVREVETCGHGSAGGGEEMPLHDVGLEVHVVQVLAGAVGFEGEHGVCARGAGGMLEGDAEVVGQGVGFVGVDVLAEFVICCLPLRVGSVGLLTRTCRVKAEEQGRVEGDLHRRSGRGPCCNVRRGTDAP